MFRKYFIAGLIIVLPVTITYYFVVFLVNLITKPFQNFTHDFLLRYHIVHKELFCLTVDQIAAVVSKFFIVLTMGLFIFLLGVVSYYFLHKFFVRISDSILGKIPFIGKIYHASKDFTNVLFCEKTNSFSQVVLVPYPSKMHYSIGFIANDFHNEVFPGESQEMVSVLIPGTPNPTIGFVLVFAKKDIVPMNMNVSDAVRLIMSCGTASLVIEVAKPLS